MSTAFIKELAKTVAKINDTKLAEDFLHNILTPSELDEISRRLQIFKLLNDGMPQRKVAKELNVALATVGRGARELKYGKPGFIKLI